MTHEEYSTTIAHLILEKEAVEQEKKAQADMYKKSIRNIDVKILELSTDFLSDQKDLFDKEE